MRLIFQKITKKTNGFAVALESRLIEKVRGILVKILLEKF